METHPREGVVKVKKFQNTREPSHQQACRLFWNLGGQHKKGGKKKKQITCLIVTPNGEVAQMLEFTSSQQGLNREVRASCLG